jgi:hypothetical protein
MENVRTKNWSIQEGWNSTLIIKHERDNKPRDILYASEIGRSYYDTYLSVMGVPATNEISDTIRRKMEAGNFYEAIVAWVFQRVGILQDTQVQIRTYVPGLMPIHGRADILAGCDGDWNTRKAKLLDLFTNLDKFEFSFPFLEQVRKLSFSLIDDLSIKYPNGLEQKIIEVKSLNSMAFWSGGEPISTPYDHHKYQLSFYQSFNKLGVTDASFIYVDRDTMSLSELPNYINDDTLKKMNEWHKQISYYVQNRIEPPKPEIVVFKEGKYQFNWEIERSDYKDLILSGIDVEKVREEIKYKNKELKDIEMIKLALSGDTEKYGIKKYIKAIELLKQNVDIPKVMKQTNISQTVVDYYLSAINKK